MDTFIRGQRMTVSAESMGQLAREADAARARVAELEANLRATVLLLGDALEREERLRGLLASAVGCIEAITSEEIDGQFMDHVTAELLARIRAALTPEAIR